MNDTTAFTPLHRQALLAGLQAQQHTFTRTRGGYLPVTGERTIFTTRTIRAMERDGLIEYRDQFAETAKLTREGVDAAKALREATTGKAGAA
jgi:hypothetical protein